MENNYPNFDINNYFYVKLNNFVVGNTMNNI